MTETIGVEHALAQPARRIGVLRWPALLVTAGALLLYLVTGAPSILTGDQAEHQFTAAVVGVPHATGYPLFTMVNALAVRIIPFGDPARRVTMIVAIYSACAIGLIFLIGRRLTGTALAGALAAASMAFMPEFWLLSTMAEVYTLQALLMLGCFWKLLEWWEIEAHEQDLGLSRRGLRHPLAAASLLAGLAATHHGSFTPIVGPALLVSVIAPLLGRLRSPAERRVVLRLCGRCLAWALLGFSPWLYLAAQYLLFQPFDYYRGQGLPYHPYWGNPQSWGDVFNLALGAGFRLKIFTHGWGRLPELLPGYVWELRQQFWWPGVALGLLGAPVLLRRHRRAGLFLLFVWLFASLFGLNIAGDVPKAHVYFLPAYVVWSLWIALGASALAGPLLRLAPRRARALPLARLWLAGLILLPCAIGLYRFERLDQSARWGHRQQAEATLAALEPDAVVLCRWEACMPLRYLQLVEGRKLGVQLDQTEPEGGVDWGDRVALYAPALQVYALDPLPALGERYRLMPVAGVRGLWRVELDQQP